MVSSGEGWRGHPFLQIVIIWRMAKIRLGASLFSFPQLERTCLSLSHVLSPLWHWNICETYSVGFPQYLGHAGEDHDTIVAITFPVDSYFAASMAAHISCLEGTFLWLVLERPSLLGVRFH